MKFIPERVSKCADIVLNGPIEKVFPLFGPVREKEWAGGWDPEIVYPGSAAVEEHMIFRTNAPHHTKEGHYLWAITKFDPETHQIEYTVSTQNRIWFISVRCLENATGTSATVCYTYTGLNEVGNELNRLALEKMYAANLNDWQEAINHYLKTGKKLSTH